MTQTMILMNELKNNAFQKNKKNNAFLSVWLVDFMMFCYEKF